MPMDGGRNAGPRAPSIGLCERSAVPDCPHMHVQRDARASHYTHAIGYATQSRLEAGED